MFRGTILLIDRFSRMNTLINSYLSASGFVVECMRSVDDLRTVRLNTIHLALLDIDTAGGRLKEILEQMKSAGVPVIVLTSESDHAGRLSALELGAADVMSRPLDIAELVARIRAAQARTQVSVTGFDRPPVSFGGLTVDISKYRAELDGEPAEYLPEGDRPAVPADKQSGYGIQPRGAFAPAQELRACLGAHGECIHKPSEKGDRPLQREYSFGARRRVQIRRQC